MRKAAIIAYVKVLTQNYSGVTKENHEKPQSRR
jgi:hypothetical protein